MSLDEVEPAAISAGRKAKTPVGGKIATGNRLRDGVVIYLDGTGNWITEVSQARVANNADEEAAIKSLLDQAVKNNFLIDAAIIEVRSSDKAPARLREQIRAIGPTVRPDLARRQPF